MHELRMSRLGGVIDVTADLIAVSPLTVALAVVERTEEVHGRDIPLVHLEVHPLDVTVIGSIVVATGIVVGCYNHLAFFLAKIGEGHHVGFPLVVRSLFVGGFVDTFVTQTETDNYVRAAVAVHVTFVAGE